MFLYSLEAQEPSQTEIAKEPRFDMSKISASMLLRTQLRPIPSLLLPFAQNYCQIRCLHHRIPAPSIPQPTPLVPDPQTFLMLIGRNLSKYASKIPTWETLFSLTSKQLKELEIEPPRSRRYLLRWREKFRKGEFGIGGDLKYVKDGKAEFRIAEVPCSRDTATATLSPGKKRIVVNTPPGRAPSDLPSSDLEPVKGLKLKNERIITGPYVQAIRGEDGAAMIVIKEGMWEDRRGHKIDGGERRQAEVRAKKRQAERKAAR